MKRRIGNEQEATLLTKNQQCGFFNIGYLTNLETYGGG